MIHVPDAEVHFRVDDYSDATSARSPVIYISPNDIYATHSLIHDNLDIIVRLPSSFLLVSSGQRTKS